MMAPTNRDEYDVWKLDHDQLEALLRRIEQAEHAILVELRCPTETVAIFDMLAGTRPAPWPARTAARDKKRALHAMHALLAVGRVRMHIAPSTENACRAAYEALTLGHLANDGAIHAEIGIAAKRSWRDAGRKRWRGLKARDRTLYETARRYQITHRGTSARATAAAVKKELHLPETVDAVRRRIRELTTRVESWKQQR
jgi:hypothetical protein